MSEAQAQEPEHGVQLPPGKSASSFLLDLLRDAKSEFPRAFKTVDLPDGSEELKRVYPSLLVEFEQFRHASPERKKIATWFQRTVSERCIVRDATGGERALGELGLNAEPLPVEHLSSTRSTGWRPRFSYRDKHWQSEEIEELSHELQGLRFMSDATGETLRRSLQRLGADGTLSLRGERFALFGAGAELAPTRALLEAGATVLWADVVAPPRELLDVGGDLFHANGRSDLLLRPDAVASTIAEFAKDEPVHLGLFAYGPGKGREWRLGAAMNAAVRALPCDRVRSVGVFVSPTTPMALAQDDAAVTASRWNKRPGWHKALIAARIVVPARGHPDLPRVNDTIVPLQGVSYQAAQWLEKTVAMEAIRADNPELPISANVAQVTKTASMNHPVFLAAFRGAERFGIKAFEPNVTRTLSTLLYIEDILGKHPTGPRYFHGGMFSLPYSLESSIRVAATLGFLRI